MDIAHSIQCHIYLFCGKMQVLSYSVNASNLYGSSVEIQSSDSDLSLSSEKLQFVAFNKRKKKNHSSGTKE